MLQIELYGGAAGVFQLILEILLTFVVAMMALHQIRMMLAAQLHEGSILAYHTGGLDTLALLSTALLTSCLFLWWTFVFSCSNFTMDLAYDVYKDLDADPFPTATADNDAGLKRAVETFERVDQYIVLLSWYFALNGIAILMHITRLLHLMHFHPRLGVVTRSLVVAMPDLFNFLLVAGVVFTGSGSLAYSLAQSSVPFFTHESF